MSDDLSTKYKRTFAKTAGFPPPVQDEGPSGGESQRNIPKDHPYDPRSIKPMSQALWAASVALGHVLTAYRQLSRLKSANVSPDGMLGGRGYVMPIKDMRQKLDSACQTLSAVTDTLYDEIQAPHWRSKLAQLDENDAEDVSRYVEESQEILEDPGNEAEKEMHAIEEENDGDEKKSDSSSDEPRSDLPGGGAAEANEAKPAEPLMPKEASQRPFLAMLSAPAPAVTAAVKTASAPAPKPMTMAERLVARRLKSANSSVSPDSLGGPRVDHIQPEGGDGPWGSYNEDEPTLEGQAPWDEYEYKSEWENDLRESNSNLPSDDDTDSEGWDFGLGYGAKGQGAGGYGNPSGEGDGTKGVWGPHSGLPGAPAGMSGDDDLAIDVNLNERSAIQSLLPGDTQPPVARSDYFEGPKDNLVQGESEMPGEVSPWHDEGMPVDIDTGYVSEDLETPYVRYDYTTHTYRDDPLHNWPQEG